MHSSVFRQELAKGEDPNFFKYPSLEPPDERNDHSRNNRCLIYEILSFHLL